jgi:hypothetical protein
MADVLTEDDFPRFEKTQFTTKFNDHIRNRTLGPKIDIINVDGSLVSGTLSSNTIPELLVSNFANSAIQNSTESFANTDTSLLTSAAVDARIRDYGYLTDYTVTEADVTAHEAALTITESQISDLGSYISGNETITLSGDASGSGTTSIAVTVADDSHNHSSSTGDFAVGGTLFASTAIAVNTASPQRAIHVSGVANAASIRIENTASGGQDTGLGINALGGLELVARGMNPTSKWTPAIKFGSADPDFTTTNPKFGASIVGVARQTYSADTTSAMALEFYITPANAGTLEAQERIALFDPTCSVYFYDDAGVVSLSINGSTAAVTSASTINGRDIATDGTKLDGIASGADVGTVTSIGLTAGSLIDITGGPITSSGNITVDVDLSELTTSTSDTDGDFFAVVDSVNAQKKLTKANIALSGFNNDSGFITGNETITISGDASGSGETSIVLTIDHDGLTNFVSNEHIDHTAVTLTAGNGLTGGGTIAASRSFAVTGGTGVTANSTGVHIGQDVAVGGDVSFGSITVSGTVDGRDVATDGTKLDTIETNATADQTAAEILAALLTVDGSGSSLDADTLDGQEASAFLTGNETITLSGDATGSGTTSITVTVVDDSHNHTNSSGNFLVGGTLGVTGHTTPVTDSLYDLGSTSLRWNELFVDDITVTDTITATSVVGTTIAATATSSRDKIRLYNTGDYYNIGFQSGVTFGGLADYAMTFQMDDDDNRGFWWGHNNHTVAQGAMSLTNTGHLTVAEGIRLGYGESDADDVASWSAKHVDIIATDDVGDVNYASIRIDHNASGSDTLTGDRFHIGLHIDYDSSASGGDTSNEHRVYGILNDVDVSADSDLVYGNQTTVRSSLSSGTTTSLYGNYVLVEADNTGGAITTTWAQWNLAYSLHTAGTVGTLGGLYNKSLAQGGAITSMYGTWSECEMSDNATYNADVTTARAVYGLIDNNIGVGNGTITTSYVFHGYVTGISATTNRGLYISGESENYLSGDLEVAGDLSKGTGSFRIDHPLPELEETHDLIHSFIEGPQADLIYRGKVDLLAGTASINLDTVSGMTEGTFEALNRDIQCFTSNESDWEPVRGSVGGNILTIVSRNQISTSTISWMVIGERQDMTVMRSTATDADGHYIVEREKR